MEEAGKQIHDSSAEIRSAAARAMGQARTPAKIQAAQETAAARRGIPLTEEHREKIREKQIARWEKIREAKAASPGVEAVPKEKKRMGRPPKPIDPNAVAAPKRGRGRPPKQGAGQSSAESG